MSRPVPVCLPGTGGSTICERFAQEPGRCTATPVWFLRRVLADHTATVPHLGRPAAGKSAGAEHPTPERAEARDSSAKNASGFND